MAVSKTHISLWIIAGLVWSVAVGLGLWIMVDYENEPGQAGKSPDQWPTTSQIHPTEGKHTLVMLVHPHCPCTRASIEQLAKIVAQCQEKLTAHVVFVRPEGFDTDWVQSDLWHSAKLIPNTQVLDDPLGIEAQRFGAVVSGQTILYNPNGQRIFTGGITPSRGHAGDNAGHQAIVSLIHTGKADRQDTFVFGCTLTGSRLTASKDSQ